MADIFKGISSGSFLGGDTGFGNILQAGVARKELDLAEGAAARDEDRLMMEQEKHGLDMQTRIRDIQIAAQARNEFGEFNRQVLGLLADPDASGLTTKDPYTGETMIDETKGLVQMYQIAEKLNMSPEAAAAAFQYIGGLFDLSMKKVEIAGKKYENAFAKADLDNYNEAIRQTDRAAAERRRAATKDGKITPEDSIRIREQEAFSRGQLGRTGAKDYRATPEGQAASLSAQVSASRGADWHNVLIDKLTKAGHTPGQITAHMTGQVTAQLQTLAAMSDMLRTTPWENFPDEVRLSMTTLIDQLTTQLSKMDDPAGVIADGISIATGEDQASPTQPGAKPNQPGSPIEDIANPTSTSYWTNQASVDLTQVTDPKEREGVFAAQNRLKRMEQTYEDYLGVGMTAEEARIKTVEIYNPKNNPAIKPVLEAMLNAILQRKGNK